MTFEYPEEVVHEQRKSQLRVAARIVRVRSACEEVRDERDGGGLTERAVLARNVLDILNGYGDVES